MSYPAEHFPGTPLWAQAAVAEAVHLTGVSPKWQVPLEAIGRYECNWNNAANLCLPPEEDWPLAAFQLAAGMFRSAYQNHRVLVPQPSRRHDPEVSAIVAILYIDSRLPGYGGYGGIGAVDGDKGLLPRTDRGPGNVLRYWIEHPDAGIEEMRPLYRGY